MKRLLFLTFVFPLLVPAADPPQAEIRNQHIKAKLYLPDAQAGFYRGTRFDWSGVIYSLEYQGHDFYGPWFTKYDPAVRDFIYKDADIVVGTGERQARRIVSALLDKEVLISESSRAPLRLAFPAALASRWMPGLFPEKLP